MPTPATLAPRRVRSPATSLGVSAATVVTDPVRQAPRVAQRAIALSPSVRALAVESLNQILADSMTLRDLYKKHHWQVNGPTFYQLHLLYDKHYTEQAGLVDVIAERVQMMGGNTIAMAADVARITVVPRPPMEREEPEAQLRRLLDAHEKVIAEIRVAARTTGEAGDSGSNDLLSGTVLQTNEMQSWFISQHLPEGPAADD